MRILFEHMMDTLAPVEEVKLSSWFKSERNDGYATRWQRVIFAIQGGFTDAFVRDEIDIDPEPLRKRLLAAIDKLSKHVHGREQTIIIQYVAQNEEAMAITKAMTALVDTIHDCRAAILEPIADALDNAAVDVLLSDSLVEVDALASHFSLDEVYVERTVVHSIGSANIIYRSTGTVAVTLQWGSNSDMRRGDGAQLSQRFPFVCDIEVLLHEPWELHGADVSCCVDATSWRDASQPDEWDG